ncbi:hypothetical protein M2352_000122 [Azospirillum fermentarium]|uniref:YdcH family protein n=1 Tax=Azospirillum fermentarium TaxID=1233114 RepID=UPI002225D057|nr:YdcH family protein [Azospirillum fermentarium]MCW2244531.1 hypothetical protein [Azospirillum fermentarium]
MLREDRIEFLRTKHKSLDSELRQQSRRLYPDDSIIAKLKKEKLRVKDEIARLCNA